MKKFYILILLSVFNVISCKSIEKINSAQYEIATWRGFKSAAISYTFDDNCSNQLSVAIPIFNDFGIKTTMFVPSSWIKDWTGLQSAADNGHEIASHTVNHINLRNLTNDQQLPEFQNSQKDINAQIKGHSCITIAYPYCVKGNDSLCSTFYIAARGCQGYIESKTPADFMNISSMVTGTMSKIQTTQNFNDKVEKADSINGWCVFLIHGIDNDGSYSPTQSIVLKSHLEYMKQHNEKFWIATFGDVVRYVKERNDAIIQEISIKNTSISLKVTVKLDNSVYNYPLTIRRILPKTWKSATIVQNGKKLIHQVSTKATSKFITFDVVPNNGNITISKQ